MKNIYDYLKIFISLIVGSFSLYGLIVFMFSDGGINMNHIILLLISIAGLVVAITNIIKFTNSEY